MDLAGALGLGERELVSFVGAGGKKTAMGRLVAEGTERSRAVGYTTTTKMPPPDGLSLVVEDEARIAEAVADERSPLAFARGWVDDPERVDRKLDGFVPSAVGALYRDGPFDWMLVKADGARMREVTAPRPDEPVVPASSTHVVAVVSVAAVGEPLDRALVHRPDRVAAVTGTATGDVVTPSTLARLLASRDGGLRNVPPGATATAMVNKADDAESRAVATAIVEEALDRADRFDAGLVTSFETGTVTRVCR